MLFMAGDQDQIQAGDVIFSQADFARRLEAQTAEPKDLCVFPGSADHGVVLLDNIAEAQDLFFLQEMGFGWAAAGESAVLVVPQEHNFLLNPQHPDCAQIRLGRSTAFDFD